MIITDMSCDLSLESVAYDLCMESLDSIGVKKAVDVFFPIVENSKSGIAFFSSPPDQYPDVIFDTEWGLDRNASSSVDEASIRSSLFRSVMSFKMGRNSSSIITKRNPPTRNASPDEQRARGLLKDLVGIEAFEKYMARGFVVAAGASGARYVISQHGTRMLAPDQDGRLDYKESLCVVFSQDSLPPTDNIVMRTILLQSDEAEFRRIANIQNLSPFAQRCGSNKGRS